MHETCFFRNVLNLLRSRLWDSGQFLNSDAPDRAFNALNSRSRFMVWTIVGCLAEQLGL